MSLSNPVSLARTLLDNGDLAAATTCLETALLNNPANLEAHNLREAFQLPGHWGTAFGINATIAPEDDIFHFFAQHPSSLNPVRDYLADGWRTLSELLILLERLDRKLSQCATFLEFACGFGRFTRHLAPLLPPRALHVSDIVPGSIDFLKSQFNVEGFYSSTNPQEVPLLQAQYEIIFVLSLFSHLPDSSWRPWLARLFSALKPGGILIISTHGERSAATTNTSLPQNGYAFFPQSESQVLSGEVYGCTYTTPVYVNNAIATLNNVQESHHFPAHFWSNQDGYAIIRSV